SRKAAGNRPPHAASARQRLRHKADMRGNRPGPSGLADDPARPGPRRLWTQYECAIAQSGPEAGTPPGQAKSPAATACLRPLLPFCSSYFRQVPAQTGGQASAILCVLPRLNWRGACFAALTIRDLCKSLYITACYVGIARSMVRHGSVAMLLCNVLDP